MESARKLRDLLSWEVQAALRSDAPPPGERPFFVVFRNNQQGFGKRDQEPMPRSRRRGASAQIERGIDAVINAASEAIHAGGLRQRILQELSEELTSRYGKWIRVSQTIDELWLWIDEADQGGDTSGHARGQDGIVVVETYVVD